MSRFTVDSATTSIGYWTVWSSDWLCLSITKHVYVQCHSPFPVVETSGSCSHNAMRKKVSLFAVWQDTQPDQGWASGKRRLRIHRPRLLFRAKKGWPRTWSNGQNITHLKSYNILLPFLSFFFLAKTNWVSERISNSIKCHSAPA